MVELIHGDCMDYMKGLDDNAFELAIVDPPYGIGIAEWDQRPKKEYWGELFRVSENQIVWGGNYFNLPINQGWVCWDKTINGKTFFKNAAKFELIWTSLKTKAEFIRYCSNGNIEGFKPRPNYNYKNEKVNHPTHKPSPLYEWLLKNYAKEGDRILDTHLGSGSSAIAAHNYNYDFVGIELDNDYYKAALKRFEQHKQQLVLY